MTCFDKVLSSEWHKVARCIQDMVSKGKGMLTSAFYWNKYCQNLIKRRIIEFKCQEFIAYLFFHIEVNGTNDFTLKWWHFQVKGHYEQTKCLL